MRIRQRLHGVIVLARMCEVWSPRRRADDAGCVVDGDSDGL